MDLNPERVVAVLTPLLIRSAHFYAQTAKPSRRDGAAIFRSPIIASVCFLGSAMAACILAGGWVYDEKVLGLVGLAWFGLNLWIWPTVIILDDDGITSRHILRKSRSIPYGEIDSASRTSDKTVTIYAKGKLKDIEIDNFHIAPDDLASELRKRGVPYYDATDGYSFNQS